MALELLEQVMLHFTYTGSVQAENIKGKNKGGVCERRGLTHSNMSYELLPYLEKYAMHQSFETPIPPFTQCECESQ